MEQWAEIRRRALVEQVSQHPILRETGMHWKTLQKIPQHSKPPGYRREIPFSKPKIWPFLDRVRQILGAVSIPIGDQHSRMNLQIERLVLSVKKHLGICEHWLPGSSRIWHHKRLAVLFSVDNFDQAVVVPIVEHIQNLFTVERLVRYPEAARPES